MTATFIITPRVPRATAAPSDTNPRHWAARRCVHFGRRASASMCTVTSGIWNLGKTESYTLLLGIPTRRVFKKHTARSYIKIQGLPMEYPLKSLTQLQMSQSSERKVTAVDSLVVNFEEESDDESAPTFSPAKNRLVRVKTLDEIKLEKIQADVAAYYSYHGQNSPPQPPADTDDLRQRIVRRIISKGQPSQERSVSHKPLPSERNRIYKRLNQDTVLGDDPLRKKPKIVHCNNEGLFQVTVNKPQASSDLRGAGTSQNQKDRQPRGARHKDKNLGGNTGRAKAHSRVVATAEEEAEVSSTSPDENFHINANKDMMELGGEHTITRRKIKLRRKLPIYEENVSSDKDEDVIMLNEDDRLSITDDVKTTAANEEAKTVDERTSKPAQTVDNTGRTYKTEDDVLFSEDDDDITKT
ncbi:hypothetical protein NQ318_005582 [Aromia moschata]|uniref:Uncharacterized protein n=1 Tax=Aromia moschata TaxID=1265417 RepID=A0AAV8XII6_9CUCU|nr:hypothetical protein NQ318_005582 [Aromia moschata]